MGVKIINLLLDSNLKNKIGEIIGKTPSEIELDLVWEALNGLFGYEIDSQERVDCKDGNDSDVLYLDYRPVTKLNSISINGSIDNISKYSIYKKNGILNNGNIFKGSGFNSSDYLMSEYPNMEIIINYTAGFTSVTFPNDLLFACILIYKKQKFELSEKSMLSSYKIDTISYTFKDIKEIENRIKEIVGRYLW